MRPTSLAPHGPVARGGLAAGPWAARGRAATWKLAGGAALPCGGHHAGGKAAASLAWGGATVWLTGVRPGWDRVGDSNTEQNCCLPGRSCHPRVWIWLSEAVLGLRATPVTSSAAPPTAEEEPGPLSPRQFCTPPPRQLWCGQTTDLTQTRPSVACRGHQWTVHQETAQERPLSSPPQNLSPECLLSAPIFCLTHLHLVLCHRQHRHTHRHTHVHASTHEHTQTHTRICEHTHMDTHMHTRVQDRKSVV